MVFKVNGDAIEVATKGRSLGEALAELDERAEAIGAIIIELRRDGTALSPEDIAAASEAPAEGPGLVELAMRPAAELKEGALETLLELLAASAAAGNAADRDALAAANEAWASFSATYGGLLSAEEASFIEAFVARLSSKGPEVSRTADQLASFFGERLAELKDPIGAMRSAAALFDAVKDDLAEVPVRLQTGRDAEAMKTMVIAVELINKTVRVLSSFSRTVEEAGGAPILIDGATIPDFYGSLNGVLRELAEAFEAKDGVLIGDLAEYEIRPRLASFYAAALSAAGG